MRDVQFPDVASLNARVRRLALLLVLMGPFGGIQAQTTLVAPADAQQAGRYAVTLQRTGRIERIAPKPSAHVSPREVQVWLPPGYEQDDSRRYPVLYLHDGQNVFDAAAAGGEWQVDEAAQRLVLAGDVAPLIIVGVGVGDTRIQDYTPVPGRGPGGVVAGGGAAAYARYLTQELKPLIDQRFRTQPGRDSTAAGGSSLGGLVSMWLLLAHGDTFGAALVVSPSVWWADEDILKQVQARAPRRQAPRIWLDVGTQEGRSAVAGARRLQQALAAAGWPSQYLEQDGATHDEASWAARVPQMLRFLQPARPPGPPPAAPPVATLQVAMPVAVSPLDVAFTAERVTLADSPALGLVGLHALRPLAPNWWIGPSVFGAVSGDRGGFFGWGLTAAYRWRQGDWSAEAGLFVGGGGGSPAWVGGGLMLRPSLALARDFGPLRLGLGVSQLHFPSGTVQSRQPFATLGWTGDALFGPPGGGPRLAADLGADHAWPSETAMTAGQYRLRHGSGRRDGTGSGPHLRVAGFVFRRDLPGLGASLQPYGLIGAAGSLSAAYAGYAELLGGLGLRYTPPGASALTLRAEAALGSGGAGAALDTAGGALQKFSLGLAWQVAGPLAVAAQAGVVDSRGRFKAHEARFELAWRGWDVLPGASRGLPGPDTALSWQPWAAAAGWTHYARMPRDGGGESGLGLVVLKLEREIGPHWRLLGAAGIAASGAAGGYASGHLGLGWLGSVPPGSGWRFGAEATLGAAGGGGVRVGDGLFGQVQGVARYAVTPSWSLQADAGWMRTRRAGLASPFLGLSSVVSFSRLQAP